MGKVLTPDEHSALERLRNPETVLSLSFEESLARAFSDAADLTLAASIALRDYPADDDCSLSRQELIELVKQKQERIVQLLNNSDERVYFQKSATGSPRRRL